MGFTAMVFKQERGEQHNHALIAVTRWIGKTWGKNSHANALFNTVDIIIRGKDDELDGVINLEVRNWSGICPYTSIQVAERKLEGLKSMPNAYYFAVSSDLKWAHYCCVEDILTSPEYKTPESGGSRTEIFYNVPKESFYLVQIK